MVRESKLQIRTEFRERRRALLSNLPDSSSKNLWDSKIRESFLPLLDSRPGYWIGYRGKGEEADPMDQSLFQHPHIQWAFPKVEGENLKLLAPENWEAFQPGAWGILEPVEGSTPIEVGQCQGALIPAIAFDHQGHRLGSGKGFYDRLLAQFTGWKVGVAYSIQISNLTLPTESHDISMDLVVTENFMLEKGPFL